MADTFNVAPLLLAGFAGIMLSVLALSFRQWMLRRWRRGAPPLHPLTAVQVVGGGDRFQMHKVHFVSRHELAETDLFCPACGGPVANRGDFSRVQRLRIDGHDNEVIVCPGFVGEADTREPCAAILAASPDTEHGDHLNDDGSVDAVGAVEPEDFYRFRRVAADRVLVEKYGLDIQGSAGDLRVAGDPAAVAPDRMDPWLPPAIQAIMDGRTGPTHQAADPAAPTERITNPNTTQTPDPKDAP